MSAARTVTGTRALGSALSVAIAMALAGHAGAQENQASPQSGEARALDRVQVTGSRIKRTDVEAALPVTVIQKSQIEAQGITSAEQLLLYLNIAGNSSDNLSSNAGIVTGPDQRGNNGVSGANLRGQGSDGTLVLLNGRRVATHGLKGRTVDLNSIPFAAIDRVEVLRDGASAVYGTDAIGGVINFITRDDYRGAEASAFVDMTEAGGGNIYRTSVLMGAGDLDEDRWNAFGTLSVRKSDILRGSDRDFTNTFQPERGLSPDTRGTPFATIFNLAGSMVRTSQVDPVDGSLQAGINTLNLPGGPGCENGGDAMGPYDFRLWGVPSSRYACAWDYPAAAVILQPVESVDFVGRATFKLSNRHQAFVEFVGSEVDAEKIFEPNQISSSTLATAAFNPSTWFPRNANTQATYDMLYNTMAAYFGTAGLTFGAPIAYRWRCIACGPRQIATNTRSYRVLFGLDGLIGDWDYSIGVSRASSESKSTLNGGYHFTDALQQALGQGLLNPFLMPGQSQSSAGIAALEAGSATGVVLYGGETVMTQIDGVVSGALPWSLPGGAIQVATGVDLRREEYLFNGDRRAVQRPVFNAPFDNANALDNVRREVKALYAEAYLPVLDSLDFTLAGRYDRYDGFGSTTNPKVSFKWRPMDALAFRGAYSTGFLVPNFNQLFTGVTESPYTGFDLADPETCPGARANPAIPGCAAIQPSLINGGKPDLQPEDSTQKSFGVVFAPVDWFNLSLDWWEIERENTIRAAPLAAQIRDYDAFRENWIRNAAGQVIAIDQRFINSGGTLTRGIELDANVTIDEFAGGRWRINLNGSHIDTFKTKSLATLPYSDNLVGEHVRYFNLPLKWKHTLAVSYLRGDWMHNVTQIYRHGYSDEVPVSVANGSYVPPQWDPDVSSYTIYNYSASYAGFRNLRLTMGVKNLLDKDPPFTAHMNDFSAGAAWEPRVADPRGRAYTLLVDYRFW